MDVALITRHAVFNYGSLLQTIATRQCVENLGHRCTVIDYCRRDEDYRRIASVLLQRNPRWNRNALTRLVYKAVQSPKFHLMGRHFDRLRKGMFPVTARYDSEEALRARRPKADIYMTGSDQVWGPIGGADFDGAYFLSFTEDSDRRVSYAASFGKATLDSGITEEIKALLARYETVTVRERSAAQVIEGWGLPVRQVLDPTLLLDSGYWDKLITDTFPEKYILVYQLHSNEDMLHYAYALAEKTGLPLVTMSSTAQHLVKKGSRHVFLPTLSQWLGYIKNAAFLVTDSFHGTAFAINFGTQFVNVLPKGTATRNQSILELTGLQDRVVTDYQDFSCYDRFIDYTRVHRIIEENRKDSLNILEGMLNL